MRRSTLLTALLMTFAVNQAHATLDGAKAAYLRGAAKEKAKDYPGAIVEYRAALVEYPAYVYADKQIANCLYYQGDKAGALAEYDTYLRGNPADAATRNFADRLRAELGAAPASALPSEAPGQAAAPSRRTFNDVFYVAFASGATGISNNDWAKLGVLASASYASSYGLGVGYQFANGFGLEGNFQYGPLRSILITDFLSSVQFDINEIGFYVEPLYRFKLGERFTLAPGIGIGYGSVSMSSPISTTGPATGSGLIYLPEVKLGWALGPGHQWMLNLDLGYWLADFSPIKSSSGTVFTDINNKNWTISNSGFNSNIKISYAFGPLFN